MKFTLICYITSLLFAAEVDPCANCDPVAITSIPFELNSRISCIKTCFDQNIEAVFSIVEEAPQVNKVRLFAEANRTSFARNQPATFTSIIEHFPYIFVSAGLFEDPNMTPELMKALIDAGYERFNAEDYELDTSFVEAINSISDQEASAELFALYLEHYGYMAKMNTAIIKAFESSILNGRWLIKDAILKSGALQRLRNEANYWENLRPVDVLRRSKARASIEKAVNMEKDLKVFSRDYKDKSLELIEAERKLHHLEGPFLLEVARRAAEKKAKRMFDNCIEMMQPVVTSKQLSRLIGICFTDPYFIGQLLSVYADSLKGESLLAAIIKRSARQTRKSLIDGLLAAGYKPKSDELIEAIRFSAANSSVNIVSTLLSILTGGESRLGDEFLVQAVNKELTVAKSEASDWKSYMIDGIVPLSKEVDDFIGANGLANEEWRSKTLFALQEADALEALGHEADFAQIRELARRVAKVQAAIQASNDKFTELKDKVSEIKKYKEEMSHYHMEVTNALSKAKEEAETWNSDLSFNFGSLIEQLNSVSVECKTLNECRNLQLFVNRIKSSSRKPLTVHLRHKILAVSGEIQGMIDDLKSQEDPGRHMVVLERLQEKMNSIQNIKLGAIAFDDIAGIDSKLRSDVAECMKLRQEARSNLSK